MSSLDSHEAYRRLTHAYENPGEAALHARERGIPVAGYTSNAVPWELLRAAGFFPVLMQAHCAETPHADSYMEPVFSPRFRSLFEGMLSRAWSLFRAVVIPRTSEQEHKLYLYVREVLRLGKCEGIPQPYLYNLLQTRSTRSRAYGLEETRRLLEWLTGISGRKVRAENLNAAIEESDAARAAMRRLLRLRRGKSPRISGSDALRVVGAWHFMDRSEYREAALALVSHLSRNRVIHGPRILIQGATLDHPGLHEAIESLGAVVTAEDDWRGTRAAGRDIRVGPDPLHAIFEKYYLDAPGPRTFPSQTADRWFQSAAVRDMEGVVFYLPPEDDVLGWDYPRQKRWLDERGIPSLLIREDARHISGETRQCIAEFSERLRAKQ